MNKDEIKTLICHQISLDCNFDICGRDLILDFFECNFNKDYEKYNLVMSEINIKIIQKKLPSCGFVLAKIYLQKDELEIIYRNIFSFFFCLKKNKKSILVIEKAGEKLGFTSEQAFEIRNDIFFEKYLKKVNLAEFSRAILGYSLVTVGNDYDIDKEEFGRLHYLLNKCKDFSMPIRFFNLREFIEFTKFSTEGVARLKKNLLDAAISDGSYQLDEINQIKDIIKKKFLSDSFNYLDGVSGIEALLSLSVLMSDGRLTQKEKEWFLKVYDVKLVVRDINDMFLFYILCFNHFDIFQKNKSFFSLFKLENSKDDEIAKKLFLVFIKKFLLVEDNLVKSFVISLSGDESCDLRSFESVLFDEDKITREELLLTVSVLTTPYIKLERFNKLLSYDHLEKIYLKLSVYSSLLEYYFICSALFCDKKIIGREYSILWNKFREREINFDTLLEAIYDYSLLKLKNFEIDSYYDYLCHDEISS